MTNMKTAISIPDSLFEAAERLAKRLGVSRSQLYQIAMAKLLADQDDDATTVALNAVYANHADLSELDPLLDRLQHASLVRDEW